MGAKEGRASIYPAQRKERLNPFEKKERLDPVERRGRLHVPLNKQNGKGGRSLPRRERDSEAESLKHKENRSKDMEKCESAKPGRLGIGVRELPELHLVARVVLSYVHCFNKLQL